MKVKLGELVKIRTGKLDANAASENGEYPFFTCSKEPLRISTYSYDCECILVAGNGDLNVKYYNGKFDAYQRTYIIKSNGDERLYLPYLYYFMTLYIQELRKISIGGVIKYIKLGNLTDVEISLPDIEEQKVACKKLEKIKNITDKKESQLSCLDNLIKARFVEMFSDKNFETKPFEDVCEELFAGGDVKRDRTVKDADSSHPYAVFTNGEKDDGLYGYTDIARVTKPSITISGRGTIGFCLVRAEPFYPAIRLIVATPKEGLVTPSYLKYFIDSKDYSGRGASIPQLTIPMIKDEPVPVPPLGLQEDFEKVVTQVDKSKFTLSNELAMGNFYIRLIHDCIMHGCINL